MQPYSLALLFVCAAAAVSAQPPSAQDALAAIDACVANLDAELDVGYARIAARCPRLARTLEQSGWAEWLPRGWKEARNDLSSGSLVELRDLVARELQVSTGTRVPNVAHLNKVLTSLGSATRERGSLWNRFRAWLRMLVERNARSDPHSWLDDMVRTDGRSQTVIDLTTYAALAVVVGLAGVIVVSEVRAAGLLRSRRRAGDPVVPAAPEARRVTWRDVEQADTAEKSRLLFELVLARLTELHRVQPAGALTVRELAHSVELPDDEDRRRLHEIARTAEQARYSAASLAPATVGKVVERGRQLLANLEAAGAG